MKISAEVKVIPKDDIKYPAGLAVENILKRTNIDAESSVRTGKFFSIKTFAHNRIEAMEKINKICTEVLTNPNLEQYEIIRIKEE